jgi:hypothetical protein
VFIRMKSRSVKDEKIVFVYVICRTLIKIKHHCVQNDHDLNSDGGLSFDRVGKGKPERLERGAKLRGLSPWE